MRHPKFISLLCTKINNEYRYLFTFCHEPGLQHETLIAPSFSTEDKSAFDGFQSKFKNPTSIAKDRVSYEGGRFYDCVNAIEITEVKFESEKAIPEEFICLKENEVHFANANGLLSIEARDAWFVRMGCLS